MTQDNRLTIAAIAILAYLSADVAHHVLGHGAACLISGGHINLLTSVFVNCSLKGSAIDLAGPTANLILGSLAWMILFFMRRVPSSTRLFIILVVAFNLFWFWLQLIFSVITMTDDWAWPMRQFHIAEFGRYGMIAVGVLGYIFASRLVARQFTCFSTTSDRVKVIVGIAWISAGVIAAATAAFDQHPMVTLWRTALPQSLLLSIGLLFIPKKVAAISSTGEAAAPLPLSIYWIITAAVCAVASIVLLGPGFTLTM